jgi:hypothetical protein
MDAAANHLQNMPIAAGAGGRGRPYTWGMRRLPRSRFGRPRGRLGRSYAAAPEIVAFVPLDPYVPITFLQYLHARKQLKSAMNLADSAPQTPR